MVAAAEVDPAGCKSPGQLLEKWPVTAEAQALAETAVGSGAAAVPMGKQYVIYLALLTLPPQKSEQSWVTQERAEVFKQHAESHIIK